MINFIILLSVALYSTQSSASRYLELADSADYYIKEMQWELAEKTLKKALNLEPANFSNSLLLSNLGIVQLNEGKPEEALQSFSLGLSIAPNSTILLNNRAKVLLETGDSEGAYLDIQKSLEIDSIQEWPLQMKALLNIDKNNFLEAEKLLSIIKEKFPDNNIYWIGSAMIEEKKGNFENALNFYEEALKKEDDIDIHLASIQLKINLNKYLDASKEINKCMSLYSEEPYLYLWRGVLHKLNYRNEEALADRNLSLIKGADPKIVDSFLPLKK